MFTNLETHKIEQSLPALPTTNKFFFFCLISATGQGKNEHIRHPSHLLLPPYFVSMIPIFNSLVNCTKIFSGKLCHLVLLK